MLKLCSIEGCGLKHFAKSYCNKHRQRFRKRGDPMIVKAYIHGNRVAHYLYHSYLSMKARCYNKNALGYDRYGGRGIVVCDRWLGLYGFSNFLSDMGDRPNGHTLDRIDVDGSYCPENCKRSTYHQQNANTRRRTECVGVYYSKKDNRRKAFIGIDRSKINLGSYKEYDDAVRARKEAEVYYNITY